MSEQTIQWESESQPIRLRCWDWSSEHVTFKHKDSFCPAASLFTFAINTQLRMNWKGSPNSTTLWSVCLFVTKKCWCISALNSVECWQCCRQQHREPLLHGLSASTQLTMFPLSHWKWEQFCSSLKIFFPVKKYVEHTFRVPIRVSGKKLIAFCLCVKIEFSVAVSGCLCINYLVVKTEYYPVSFYRKNWIL